ncbi:hypothetical protein RHSIM_Rhsim03G0116300 [Rhododendron simsii]|uniref:Uncharacterized protein n=1 Tax=Rhododendron simsii TaxID=118357 RepID=A0A834H6I4_RHOSS|nr:hypothetical protein RHSIM_Rhsim03G0116300 [Rhododendron simsii]
MTGIVGFALTIDDSQPSSEPSVLISALPFVCVAYPKTKANLYSRRKWEEATECVLGSSSLLSSALFWKP